MTDSNDPTQELLLQAQMTEEVRREHVETIARWREFLSQRGVEPDQIQSLLLVLMSSYLQMGKAAGVSTRKQVERALYDHGLVYEEPWSSLIAQEFEGEGLTDEEIDEYIASMATRFAAEQRREAALFDQCKLYRRFLEAHGVVLNDKGEGIIFALATMKLIRKIRQQSLFLAHEEALIVLIESGFDQEPWRLLVDHEFLEL